MVFLFPFVSCPLLFSFVSSTLVHLIHGYNQWQLCPTLSKTHEKWIVRQKALNNYFAIRLLTITSLKILNQNHDRRSDIRPQFFNLLLFFINFTVQTSLQHASNFLEYLLFFIIHDLFFHSDNPHIINVCHLNKCHYQLPWIPLVFHHIWPSLS